MSPPSSEIVALSAPPSEGLSPSSVLPKALPDVDDVSMKQVSSYLDYYRQDVYWSFLSDSFFVVGGICYVILSLPGLNRYTHFHSILEFVAPTVYLLNSFIDVKWAQEVKKRNRLKNEMTETWNYWKILLDKDEEHEGQTAGESSSSPTGADATHKDNQPWYIRLRKHAAHRRTLLAAWTFGIAAFYSVLAVMAFHWQQHSPWTYYLGEVSDAISVHVYILSAIISVSGKRTRPWLCIGADEGCLSWLDSPETLEDLGDLLFLFGSVVDGVLCDFTFDDNRPGWGITSACLWFIDACLYLKADFILARRMTDPQEMEEMDESCRSHRSDGFV